MSTTKSLLVLLSLNLLIINVYAQNIRRAREVELGLKPQENFDIAEHLFEQHAYQSAIDHYEKVITSLKESGKTDEPIFNKSKYQAAESYRELRQYAKASNYYNELSKDIDYPLARYYNGMMLKAQKKYDDSDKQFEKYIKENEQNQSAFIDQSRLQLESNKLALTLIEQPLDIDISLLSGINTDVNNEFSVANLDSNTIIFSGVESVEDKEKRKFEDIKLLNDTALVNRLFTTGIDGSNKRRIDLKIDSYLSHVVSPTYHKPSGKLFYSVCTPTEKGVNCNIYYSTKEKEKENNWSKPVLAPSPVNIEGAESKHPMISTDKDGTGVFLFTSDRNDGIGSWDIYTALIDSLGNISDVSNAGAQINTAGNDITPFFDLKKKVLYYSSDGLLGMGGFDIHMVHLENLQPIEEPQNLGYPINSGADDSYFILNDNGRSGYLSSNRAGNTSYDDIFSFVFGPNFDYKKLAANHNDIFLLDEEDDDGRWLLAQEDSIYAMGYSSKSILIYLQDENGNTLDSTSTDSTKSFVFKKLPTDRKFKFLLNDDQTNTQVKVFVMRANGDTVKIIELPEDKDLFSYRKLNEQHGDGIVLNEEDEDIYLFNPEEPDTYLIRGNTGREMTIHIINESNQIVSSVVSNPQGDFDFRELPSDHNFKFLLDDADSDDFIWMHIINSNGDTVMQLSNKDHSHLFNYRKLDEQHSDMLLLNEEDDDMFLFNKETEDFYMIRGQSERSLSIHIIDKQDRIITSITSDDNGSFNFKKLPSNREFRFLVDDKDDSNPIWMEVINQNGEVIMTLSNDKQSHLFKYRKLEDLHDDISLLNEDDEKYSLTTDTSPSNNVADGTLEVVEHNEPVTVDFLTALREYNSQLRSKTEYRAFMEKYRVVEFYNFKVQVGAYQRPEYRSLSQFDPLERTDSDGMTRYFWGTFDHLNEAENRRKLAVQKGIHDAFIAIYFGEERIGILIYPKTNN